MCGQVKFLNLPESRGLAAASAEEEGLSMFGGFEAGTGGGRVGVTNEENRLVGIADHAHRQIMGGGILAHHAGSDDEEAPAAELHSFGLSLFEHNEIERLAQLKIRMLPMRAVGFQIVNLREHAAKPPDINRLFLKFLFGHQN